MPPQSLKTVFSELLLMLNIYLPRPDWFFGLDAGLEAFAGVIALLIAFASYKLYRSTGERSYKYFLVSFFLLGLSFLSRAVADAFLGKVFFEAPAKVVAVLFFAGYAGHFFLALSAYILLVASSFNIADKRLLVMLFLIMIPALLLSGSYFLSFYVISIILLAFIAWAYFQNFRKVGSVTSCLVFITFLLLTLAQPQFILDSLSDAWYVTAHATQALAYLVLLVAMLRILFK